jgi:lysophospholipase L1-like esterase
VGFLLVGYMMSQRGGGPSPAAVGGRRAVPGGGSSNLDPAANSARVHNKGGDVKPAMGNKPAPTKVRARNEPREDDKWLGVHNKYSYEVEALSRRGADVVFYGDSVFEAFRGTKVGIANKQFEGVPAVWSSHLKSIGQRGSLDLAISGDTASNLLWRVRNGESPAPLDPRVLVVNVGTNDIKRVSVEGDPEDLASGTRPGKDLSTATAAIVDTLLEQTPDAHVVLVGVLPRGDESAGDQRAQPSKYTPTIDATNANLREYAKAKGHAAKGGVTFVDCGQLLLEDVDGGRKRIKSGAMPDATHPSAESYEVIVKSCLAPAISKALNAS